MSVRPDDVWVVTYPKCGTTWTQEMVWQIAHGVDLVGGKKWLNDRLLQEGGDGDEQEDSEDEDEADQDANDVLL